MPAKQRRWEAVVGYFRSAWASASAPRAPQGVPRAFWEAFRFPDPPKGGAIRQAAADAGYQLAQGISWLDIPGTDFVARAGNVVQGFDWFARGVGEAASLGAGTAVLLGGAVGAAGLAAAASAAFSAEQGLAGGVRSLAALSGLSVKDAAAQQQLAARLGIAGAPARYAAYAQRQSGQAQEQLLAQGMRGGRPLFYAPAFADPLARYGLSAFEPGSPFAARARPFDQVLFAAAADVARRRRVDPGQAAIEQQLFGDVLLGSSTALARLADRIDAAAKLSGRMPASWADVLPPEHLFDWLTQQNVDDLTAFDAASHDLEVSVQSVTASLGAGLIPVVAAFLQGLTAGIGAARRLLGPLAAAAGLGQDTGGVAPPGGGFDPGAGRALAAPTPPPSTGGFGAVRGPAGGGGPGAAAQAGRLVAWALAGFGLAVLGFIPWALAGLIGRLPVVRGLLDALGAVFRNLWRWFFGGMGPTLSRMPTPNTPPFAAACLRETAAWGTDVANAALAWADAVVPLASRAGALAADVAVTADASLDANGSDQPLKLKTQWPTATPQIAAAFAAAGASVPDLVLADAPAVSVAVQASEPLGLGSQIGTWQNWRTTAGQALVAVAPAFSSGSAANVGSYLALPAQVAGAPSITVHTALAWTSTTTLYTAILAPPAVAVVVAAGLGFAGAADLARYGALSALNAGASAEVTVTEGMLRPYVHVSAPANAGVVEVQSTTVRLQWQLTGPFVELVRVLVSRWGAAWEVYGEYFWSFPADSGSWWQLELSDLAPATSYQFAVQTVYEGEGSAYSTTPTYTTGTGQVIIGPPAKKPWERADPDELKRRIEAYKTLQDLVNAVPAVPGNRDAPETPQVLNPVFNAAQQQYVVQWAQAADADVAAVYAWSDQNRAWLLVGAAVAIGVAVLLLPAEVVAGVVGAGAAATRFALAFANGETDDSGNVLVHLSDAAQFSVSMPFDAPSHFQAAEVAYGWVVLAWDYPGDAALGDGFYLAMCVDGDPAGPQYFATAGPTVRRFQVDSLSMDTSYVFQIRAFANVDLGGQGGASVSDAAEVRARTLHTDGALAPVANLRLVAERLNPPKNMGPSWGNFVANVMLHVWWDDPRTTRRDLLGYKIGFADQDGVAPYTFTWPYGPPFSFPIWDDGNGGWAQFDVTPLYTTGPGDAASTRWYAPLATVPATPVIAGWSTGYDKTSQNLGSYATVSWKTVTVDATGNPTHVLGYTFAWQENGGAWNTVKDADGTPYLALPDASGLVTHTFAHLSPGANYALACYAVNTKGASVGSAVGVVAAAAPFVMPGVKLDGVAMDGSNQVRLGWEVVPESLAFGNGPPHYPVFYLYWRADGAAYATDDSQRVAVGDGTARTGTIPLSVGLRAGALYWFKVVYGAIEPVAGAGRSHYADSNEQYLAIPAAGAGATAPDVVAPSMVQTSYQVQANGDVDVTVSWEYSTEFVPNPTSFRVEKASNDTGQFADGDFGYAGLTLDGSRTDGSARAWTDYYALADLYYAYRVVAEGRDANGNVVHEAASSYVVFFLASNGGGSGGGSLPMLTISPALQNQGAVRNAIALFESELRATLAAAGIG